MAHPAVFHHLTPKEPKISFASLPSPVQTSIISLLPWEDQVIACMLCNDWKRISLSRTLQNSRYTELPSLEENTSLPRIHKLLSQGSRQFGCTVKSGKVQDFWLLHSKAPKRRSGRHINLDISKCPFIDEPVFYQPEDLDKSPLETSAQENTFLNSFRIASYIRVEDKPDSTGLSLDGPEWLKEKGLTVRNFAGKVSEWIEASVKASRGSRLSKREYEVAFLFEDGHIRAAVYLWNSYLWRLLDAMGLTDD